ncbi:unnamed protein product [Mytilus coruscus]|uniref:Uncharacterized protein n=1 Tax=Mytilus coruscus TaxID=42192 RepID=A0A6J8ATJ4_MYTCO|nr:unnamed protein product [Mytilus coruscus]
METSSDEKAMEYFKETLKFKNGRYYVKWPWEENTLELLDNRELALATIEHHVDMYNTPVADKIKNNIYVDNLISGCKSVQEALKFYSETKYIFKEAAMNLREWISNNSSINELLTASDKTDVLQVSVLGHIWNIEDDKVAVKPSKFTVCPGKTTKRRTLMELAEIFDPIGLFSPIIISWKMFLQDLWKRNLKWDDELSTEDLSKWINISSDLKRVSEIFIPRCVYLHSDSNDKKCKLLCFCDTSARAYLAAVYLHQTCEQSSRSNLIFSKSRLAPVKEMSIPRLELMAVLIGVRSLIFVKSELNISIEEMWSDSQCVLKWISTKKELNVFVKNRIDEIKASKDIKFMYVITKENPADVATRGTTVSKLKNDSLWWHGPKWLSYDTQKWTNDSFEDNLSVEKIYQSEIKRENSRFSTLLCNQTEEENRPPFGIDCREFSSYTKVIRVTAWIQRFVSRMKKDKCSTGKVLTYKELKVAEMNWIKYIQRKHYLDVFEAINENKKIIYKDN